MVEHQKRVKVLRNFIPVGQGAFYCEQFVNEDNSEKIFNVVYDCGSLTSKEIVEAEIRGTFKKDENITALFISHFDDDHVNGIPFLLKYCRVKRIFFPILTNADMILMSMTENKDSFSNRFFNDPLSTINELSPDQSIKLYAVKAVSAENDSENKGLENEEKKYDEIIKKIEPGEDVFQEIENDCDEVKINWAYIPFNFRQNERAVQLRAKLNKAFDNMSLEELKNNCFSDTEICRKVKSVYKEIKGSINTNSMTLFSGPLTFTWNQRVFNRPNCLCVWNREYLHEKVGCLYMGDYDASGKQKYYTLKTSYTQKRCWDKIGCIQIPHHGSRHNFNEDLLDNANFFIISAGFNNRFRHPHNIVINNMLSRGITPNVITEHKGTFVSVIVEMDYDEGL